MHKSRLDLRTVQSRTTEPFLMADVKEQLAADGYAVIEHAVSEQVLDALRLEAARLEEMAADEQAHFADPIWAATHRQVFGLES